jgi:hypothetical protein
MWQTEALAILSFEGKLRRKTLQTRLASKLYCELVYSQSLKDTREGITRQTQLHIVVRFVYSSPTGSGLKSERHTGFSSFLYRYGISH